MIQKPANWENITPIFSNSRKTLPAGAYKCQIIAVEQTTSKTGKVMLKMAFDVADGEYKGIYKGNWDAARAWDKSASYPNDGIHYVVTEGDERTIGRFKGFISCLEESNNFVWDFDETKLMGKFFAGQFREEERIYNDKVYTNTRLANVYPLSELGTIPVLPPKKAETASTGGFAPSTASDWGQVVTANDVPF